MNKRVKISLGLTFCIIVVGSALFLYQNKVHAETAFADLGGKVIFESLEKEFTVMNDLGVEPTEVSTTIVDDESVIVTEGYTDLSEEEHEKMKEKMNENYEKLEEMIENGELEGVSIGRGE